MNAKPPKSTGWQKKRANTVMRSVRSTIDPASLGDQQVYHYSIPEVQNSGGGVIQKASELDSSKLLISEETLLVAKLNPRKGTVVIARPHPDYVTVASTEFVPLVPAGINLKYAYYVWSSEPVRQLLSSAAVSVTRSHQRVDPVEISKLDWVWPPSEAQTAIACFLDAQTSDIDMMMKKQESLVQLLEEKKQAVISHAVTKGLDTKAAMSASGIAWLGDVPAHWRCLALTRVAKRVVVGIAEAATHAYTEDGVPILRSTNIRSNRIEGTLLRILPEFAAERGSKSLRAGDLVTVRTGAPGVTAVVPPELDGCQCFTMLITTLGAGCDSDFVAFAINSDYGQRFFTLEGWGSAQLNISVPILKAFPLAVPPLAEQQAIVRYLRVEMERIDALIAKAEHSIDLMLERRDALIAAAVAGEIDVEATGAVLPSTSATAVH